jgi:hypothetical protein
LYVSILVQLSLAVLLGFLRGFGGPVRLFRVRSLGSPLYVLFGSRRVLFTGVPYARMWSCCRRVRSRGLVVLLGSILSGSLVLEVISRSLFSSLGSVWLLRVQSLGIFGSFCCLLGPFHRFCPVLYFGHFMELALFTWVSFGSATVGPAPLGVFGFVLLSPGSVSLVLPPSVCGSVSGLVFTRVSFDSASVGPGR